MKGKHSTHLVNVPKDSISSTSDPDYYNEHSDPVYANMVNIQDNKCRHLIWFPISTELAKLRNSVESSIKCPTVLLKADTGTDLNLMNSRTFDSIFNDRTVLQPSSLRMEAYGNNSFSGSARKIPCIYQMERRVYRQLFYITNVNNLPNLLSRDCCYTLSVIKPCYSVESTGNSRKFQGNLEVTSTQPTVTLDKVKI